jgi:hypothetical protein
MATAPPAWADPNTASDLPTTTTPTSAVDHEAELFRPYSTLDEPIRETILRDVRAVVEKLKVVLKPLDSRMTITNQYSVVATTGNTNHTNEELSPNDQQVISSLKDWDLWGPLVLCLTLAVLLSFKAPTNQASLVFAAVFCTVWAGSTVVTINAQLLGGTISFFQSVCVLGYSVFPLTLSATAIGVLRIVFNTWWWIDFILVSVGFMWAIRASSVFISIYIKPERRFLALYPVFFFYTFLSWMILLF